MQRKVTVTFELSDDTPGAVTDLKAQFDFDPPLVSGQVSSLFTSVLEMNEKLKQRAQRTEEYINGQPAMIIKADRAPLMPDNSDEVQ